MINGPSEPVPVSGQVGVTSLPAVQVSSLPAVQLDTSEPIPVAPVGQPALQPFGKEESVFTTLSMGSGSFTVPAGKRLYIETISVRGSVPQGHVPFTDLDVTTGGEQITHPLPVALRGFDGVASDQYVGLHEVHIVADAGSTVQFRAFRRTGGGTMALGMSVSGHLVDAQ